MTTISHRYPLRLRRLHRLRRHRRLRRHLLHPHHSHQARGLWGAQNSPGAPAPRNANLSRVDEKQLHENAGYDDLVSDLITELKIVSDDLESCSNSLCISRSLHQEKSDEVDQLTRVNDKYEARIIGLKTQISDLQSREQSLKTQVQESQRMQQHLESTIGDLSKQLEEANDDKDCFSKLNQDQEQMKRLFQDEIHSLLCDKENQNQESHRLETTVKNLEKRMERVNHDKDCLSKRCHGQEREMNQTRDLFQNEIQSMKSEHDHLKRLYTEKHKQMDTVSHELEQRLQKRKEENKHLVDSS